MSDPTPDEIVDELFAEAYDKSKRRTLKVCEPLIRAAVEAEREACAVGVCEVCKHAYVGQRLSAGCPHCEIERLREEISTRGALRVETLNQALDENAKLRKRQTWIDNVPRKQHPDDERPWCAEYLRAMSEIDRLREALEKIADETAATWVSDLARAALGGADGSREPSSNCQWKRMKDGTGFTDCTNRWWNLGSPTPFCPSCGKPATGSRGKSDR